MSIGAIALGPVLYKIFARIRGAQKVLNLVVLCGIFWMLFAHVFPEVVAIAGIWAIVAGIIGFVTPLILEAKTGHSHGHGHGGHDGCTDQHRLPTAAIFLAFLALALHAATDGAALALGDALHAGHDHGHDHGNELGFAVILHRIPVGAGLYAAFSRGQRKGAGVAVALICVMTAVGFFAAESAMELLSGTFVAVLQAFAAGALLHVFVHPDEFSLDLPHREEGEHGHGHGEGDDHGH